MKKLFKKPLNLSYPTCFLKDEEQFKEALFLLPKFVSDSTQMTKGQKIESYFIGNEDSGALISITAPVGLFEGAPFSVVGSSFESHPVSHLTGYVDNVVPGEGVKIIFDSQEVVDVDFLSKGVSFRYAGFPIKVFFVQQEDISKTGRLTSWFIVSWFDERPLNNPNEVGTKIPINLPLNFKGFLS